MPMLDGARAVVVVSPFKATAQRTRAAHLEWAKLLCVKLARAGYRPWASHITCPLFLDEDTPADRALGLEIEREWITRCDALAVWDVWGVSSGMAGAMEFANRLNIRRATAPIGACFSPSQITIALASAGEVEPWKDLKG